MPSTWPPDMGAVVAASLEDKRRQYESTGNPMWAWSALQEVLEYDLPLPAWLREYLLESALLLLGTAADDKPNYSARILAALGFRRRRGTDDLREYSAEMDALVRGLMVDLRVRLRGMSMKKAAEDLEAKEGVSSRALQDAWNRYRDRLASFPIDEDGNPIEK